ncbi:MAG: hypothetical protein ABIP51_23215 [Bacteroidia bacterium]
MNNFKIGDKVTLLIETLGYNFWEPKFGKVYTIIGIAKINFNEEVSSSFYLKEDPNIKKSCWPGYKFKKVPNANFEEFYDKELN